jgi:hypothetical protein
MNNTTFELYDKLLDLHYLNTSMFCYCVPD